MAEEVFKKSVFKRVDFHPKTNNADHHTSEISEEQLIVRRGQPFKLTVELTEPFNPKKYPLFIIALTGTDASLENGTKSHLCIPDVIERSPSAKKVWKLELDKSSTLQTLNLTITPPADCPIGEYIMCAKYKEDETLVAMPVVLFNPWCKDDAVYMSDEDEIKEYVMNEQGVIYKGSGNYIFPMDWDFGQFEPDMVTICMKLLDESDQHLANPAEDVSKRCDPVYIGRLISAMINSADDKGVLKGRWGGPYFGGHKPSHWAGSHAILKQWHKFDCYPVKYGQCWVFAGVMCSVMRLLGIPCRVVTNYESAHDVDKNLIVDVFHADYGVRQKPSRDSVWNFHVWTEGFMKRPDLSEDGKYDGWQVLDPTPQEKSEGVYRCGPASVKSILNGDTDFDYDVPFVFAEVNAECIDWLVKADGSKIPIMTDSKRIGQNISTKSVGSKKRMNITDTYKHREGSEEERAVFKYACTRDYSRDDGRKEEEDEVDEVQSAETGDGAINLGTGVAAGNAGTGEAAANAGTGEAAANAGTGEAAGNAGTGEAAANAGTGEAAANAGTGEAAGNAGTGEAAGNAGTGVIEAGTLETVSSTPPPPPVILQFKEVSQPLNYKDVELTLVLHSTSSIARELSITISVEAMNYDGSSVKAIQQTVKKETLQPKEDLSIPVVVPFLAYHKHMGDSDIMKVSAVVKDKQNPQRAYLAEDDLVLLDPPISLTVDGEVRVKQGTIGELIFANPVGETLTNCTLTISGSGLCEDETEHKMPDLKPNTRLRVRFTFRPYKIGMKTLVADFDCATFRDIKGYCTFNVRP